MPAAGGDTDPDRVSRQVLRTDVAVVGGGVIGLAVAWRAARAGLRVALFDETPGRGATWAAAGMLAPVTEVHYGEEALLQLNLESARRYPSFVAELEEATEIDVGYRRSGTLVVARDADDGRAVDDLQAFQERLGLSVARLDARACRALEPALSPRIRGGLLVQGDHSIDNRALVQGLLVACARAGIAVLNDRVVALEMSGDRVQGLRTTSGATACGAVVLACGCHSGHLEGLPPDALPPVRPVKGQVVHLRGVLPGPLIERTIRGLDAYVVPRADGRLVIGATVEEMGFDRRVTAGAVHQLLRDAYQLIPGIVEAELTETIAGLRPGSPDNAPLVGPAGPEGLFVASGHYRNGILLAPVTADLLTEMLLGAPTPAAIAPFSPRRFARSGVTTR
ncbi:MAG: glycine oxidase ThiO [Actinomycetota bacterium]